MSMKSEAAKDAFEFARAQMAYGEGAGTRRKLIGAQVDYKLERIPGYFDAFYDALNNQDMEKHAKKAKNERRLKDTKTKVERNARSLLSGNKENLTVGVGIAVTVGYFLHETGYDKIIAEQAKQKYRKAKNRVVIWRAEHRKAKDGPILRGL